jgi:hypothetical protein
MRTLGCRPAVRVATPVDWWEIEAVIGSALA